MVEKTLPAVNERLLAVAGTVKTGNETVTTQVRSLGRKVDRLADAVEDSLNGTVSFTFTPGRSRMMAQSYDPALRQREVSPSAAARARARVRGGEALSRASPAGQSTFSCRLAELPRPAAPPISMSAGGEASLPPSLAPVERLAAGPVPTYRLSRDVGTVSLLWREWTVGLAGLPSVDSLDEDFGPRWRTGSERQYYSTRKIIVDEIRRRAGAHTGPACAAAAEILEGERRLAKASLDKMSKLLRQDAQTRKKAEVEAEAGREAGAAEG
jgi:hypothetical protein